MHKFQSSNNTTTIDGSNSNSSDNNKNFISHRCDIKEGNNTMTDSTINGDDTKVNNINSFTTDNTIKKQ